MTFKHDGMKVKQPVDPHQGFWYTNKIQENMERDVLKNI